MNSSHRSQFPTYQKLFGSAAYHTVPPGRSILSPAAYFVDLMKQVETTITPLSGSKTQLKDRRPDLWEIVLDEENTVTEIPKLEIVNSVLKAYVDQNSLIDAPYPFNLPYNKNLAAIQSYLAQNDENLAFIWRRLIPEQAEFWTSAEECKPYYLQQVGLSCEQWAQYKEPDPPATDPQVPNHYGLGPGPSDNPLEYLAHVPNFLQKTDMTRPELESLLYQDLSPTEITGEINKKFYINVGPNHPIELEGNTLHKLADDTNSRKVTRLDRIQRFVRMSHALDWSFADLDWALSVVQKVIAPSAQMSSISDECLPYLAWMQSLRREAGLCVNQSCALLGELKAYGRKEGVSFIEGIFAVRDNPRLLPSRPGESYEEYLEKWQERLDGTNPSSWPHWKKSPSEQSDKNNNKKIQNALAASLHMDQSDLLFVLNTVAPVAGDKFGTTPKNLALLYRLSLLPLLTGFSFKEAIAAAELIGQKKNLFKPGGLDGHRAISALRDFCSWLRTSPFSLPQLQFILTGESVVSAIQNSALGHDTIANFLSRMKRNIAKTKLTDDRFFKAIETDVRQFFTASIRTYADLSQSTEIRLSLESALSYNDSYARQISENLHGKLSETTIIDPHGIVLHVDIANVEVLFGAAFDVITEVLRLANYHSDSRDAYEEATAEDKSKFQELYQCIRQVIFHYRESQQETFTHNLSALFGTPGPMGSELMKIGDISIQALGGSVSQRGIDHVSTLNALAGSDVRTATPLLQKLQRVAEVIQGMALSTAEVAFLRSDLSSLFAANDPETKLQCIKRALGFKNLVTEFNDSQNQLLAFLSETNRNWNCLKKIGGWSGDDIEFLTTKIDSKGWFSGSNPPSEQVALMAVYFRTAESLGLSVQDIWSIVSLAYSAGSDLRTRDKNVAHALWGGLRAQYAGQPEKLQAIQDNLSAALRDHLVPMTIHKLANTLQGGSFPMVTARDLYEYLLIDVEVSGSLRTSVIKEAITAVQLYIYRCLNKLEHGVEVDSGLARLWQWMHSYREWQANREVFLYPEDYMQPELRGNKTDLFAKVEDDLKQADLTNPHSVTGTFREYMNGLATVGGLTVVGSAARDLKSDGTAIKELALVGMTAQAPHHFYYRVASFSFSEIGGIYTPIDWGQWRKINIQIHPVKYETDGNAGPERIGEVTPVFAFGTWYLFWVQQKQSGSTTPSDGESAKKIYTATVLYSYLDFSRRWVTEQTLASIELPPGTRVTRENSAVCPAYFFSAETLIIPFFSKLYTLSESGLGADFVAAYRFYMHPSPIVCPAMQRLHEDSQLNYAYFPNKNLFEEQGRSFSTWFNIGAAAETSLAGIQLKVGEKVPGSNISLKADTWYHLFISDGTAYADRAAYLNGSKIQQPTLEGPPISGVLWACTKARGLYFSRNGTDWTQASAPGAPLRLGTYRNCASWFKGRFYLGTNFGLYYCLDPEQPDSVWTTCDEFSGKEVRRLHVFDGVLYAGTNEEKIYLCVDGENWQSKNSEFEVNYFFSKEHVLYAGTSAGVFYNTTPKNISSWERFFPRNDLNVTCLCFFSGKYFIGTKGNGFFYAKNRGDELTQFNDASAYNVARDLKIYNEQLYAYIKGKGVCTLSDSGNQWDRPMPTSPDAMDDPASDDPRSFSIFDDSLYLSVENDPGIFKLSQSGEWEPAGDDAPSGARSLYVYQADDFIGTLQETLFFEQPLGEQKIKALYKCGKDSLTRDFEISVPSAFGDPGSVRHVRGQPNWTIVDSDKAEYLAIPNGTSDPSRLTCYRLNSTAIKHLGTLLHRPDGIDTLLSVAAQRSPEYPFAELSPNKTLVPSADWPSGQIDFTDRSAMRNYYWELFFHLPFLISRELFLHQHFQHARTWIEYIFNPSDAADHDYWRFLGLRGANNPTLKTELSEGAEQEIWSDFEDGAQRHESETDPFDPFAIADLRPIAYQKTVVTHFIDILLAWGDKLYRQNTRESIAEAEMFYVAAYDLLGEEPTDLGPAPLRDPTATYESVRAPVFHLSQDISKVLHICDVGGAVYVGTDGNGLWVKAAGSETWIREDSLKAPNIPAICAVDGSVFVGTHGKGLWCKAAGSNTWEKEDSVKAPNIPAICDVDGAVFVGTHRKGLWCKAAGSNAWEKVSEFPKSTHINALYTVDGSVFVGTHGKGLWCKSTGSNTWEQGSGFPSNSQVMALCAVDGSVFAGTVTKGLWCKAAGSNIWEKVSKFPINTQINALCAVDGSVFAGSYGHGLWKRSAGSDTWKRVSDIPKNSKVYALCAVDAGVLVGTYSDGLWVSRGYFGIPRNKQFLAYWDTVKQRLHNIRHGLTIDGKRDVLPLFQPPLNPMALVAAVASGEPVATVANSQNATIPYYRFDVMIEKAKSVTQTVIQLGQTLLSALERKDAEQLAMIYTNNQYHILAMTRTSKQDQLHAAAHNVQALQANLAGAKNRLAHYRNLIDAGLSAAEIAQTSLASASISAQLIAEPTRILSVPAYMLPTVFGLADGGVKPGDATNQGANIAEGIGNLLNQSSGLAGTVASFQRRAQDWQLQMSLAQDDVAQIQYQIVSAQYQQHLAEQELAVLETSATQARSVAEFYLRKFTNSQLYQWYAGQVSTFYFQAYQLAHDLAVQAENAWTFETTGRPGTGDPTGFVKPGGYWNNLYQGLLAGEALQLDLQHMEKAFIDRNERPLEIEKTISLAQLDPAALMDLRKHGRCTFDLTEKDFDFDFPGHFCRQIRTLSLSLPVMLGPYQNIHATLTQLSNKIVTADDEKGKIAVNHLLTGNGDPGTALKVDVRPNQQVALSRGVNDSGLFELNFNDPRYLPFEGTGAVSSWMLEMPLRDNSIDFDGLADVIIQMRYTAFAGKTTFKDFVERKRGAFSGFRIFSLAQEFGPAWQSFADPIHPQPLHFDVDPAQWRQNMPAGSKVEIESVALYLDGAARLEGDVELFIMRPNNNNAPPIKFPEANGGFALGNPATGSPIHAVPGNWKVTYSIGTGPEKGLPPEVKNIVLVAHYSVTPQS